jgi:ammonium transporter, Amt family
LANEALLFTINNTWMLVATFLVFLMHLGFATLESGVTQSKNTVNILFKNVSVVAIGILTYALVGFNLMYPGEEFAGAIFGFAGFGIGTDAAGVTSAYNPGYTYWTDFLFQGMFAATAATIVSGAVAERIKLNSFLVFAAIYVAIIYPIAGMWKWGGGWLDAAGFHDFAGSTIVHCVGGWAALVGALMLGPRIGRFDGKKAIKISGHNLPLAVIGVFLLWFGWYGFNGGSVLSADPGPLSFVFVTTSLAAAAGVIGAKLTAWAIHRQADLLMIINGALAGLVGITAGADVVSPMAAVVIGAIAGVLVVLATLALEKLRIDDPVGAVPVHLVCGVWGTLAVGIFAPGKAFLPQLLGVAAIAAFCGISSFVIFFVINKTVGLRVSAEHELTGLDINEHGTGAYSGVEILVAAPPAPVLGGGGSLEPASVAYAPPEV